MGPTVDFAGLVRHRESEMHAARFEAKGLTTFHGSGQGRITLDRSDQLLPGSEAEAAELFDACLDGWREAAEERDRSAAPTPA